MEGTKTLEVKAAHDREAMRKIQRGDEDTNDEKDKPVLEHRISTGASPPSFLQQRKVNSRGYDSSPIPHRKNRTAHLRSLVAIQPFSEKGKNGVIFCANRQLSAPVKPAPKSFAEAFGRLAKAGMSTGFLHKRDHHHLEEVSGHKHDHAATNFLHQNFKWVIPFVCVSFFLTKTWQPLLLQWNRINGRYPFAPTSSIWVSRIILTGFFLIWMLVDKDASKSIMFSAKEWRMSIPFIGVSVCTVGNVLSIYLTVEYLGAGQYAVLKNLNLVLTAILIYFWLAKTVTPTQWSCVLVITLATFIFRIQVFDDGGMNAGYIFVLLGVVFSTLEGILLQLVTKRLPEMSFQRQSFYYHFYSMILSFILMITYDYETVFYKTLGPFHGWNYKLVVYLVCIVPLVSMKHAVAGMASAIMVKLIVAATTVSTFIFSILWFGTETSPTKYLSALIICVSLVCYQLEGNRVAADIGFKLHFVHGRIKPDNYEEIERGGEEEEDSEAKNENLNPLESKDASVKNDHAIAILDDHKREDNELPKAKNLHILRRRGQREEDNEKYVVIQCSKCRADVCKFPTVQNVDKWVSMVPSSTAAAAATTTTNNNNTDTKL